MSRYWDGLDNGPKYRVLLLSSAARRFFTTANILLVLWSIVVVFSIPLRVLRYYGFLGTPYKQRMVELEEQRNIQLSLQVMEKKTSKRRGQSGVAQRESWVRQKVGSFGEVA